MSNNQKYITDVFPVKLTKEDIPHLLQDTSNINGLVTIAQGNEVLSAKSLLGLLNIDYHSPMEMIIQAHLTDKELKTLKAYELTF